MRPNQVRIAILEFTNNNHSRAATYIKNASKEELVEMLINPDVYGYDMANPDFVRNFQLFVQSTITGE